MSLKTIAVAAVLAVAAIAPSAASADSPICHNGILSDDAGMGCADGLYAAAHGGSAGSSDPAICHNGILSDDAGQGCSDGLYQQVYGSGGGSRVVASAPAPASPPSTSAPSGTLSSIAACESGGDPTAVSPGGTYRGKYQFDQQTWESVGGSGDPAAASEATQDAMAARLLAQRGTSPWPVCG